MTEIGYSKTNVKMEHLKKKGACWGLAAFKKDIIWIKNKNDLILTLVRPDTFINTSSQIYFGQNFIYFCSKKHSVIILFGVKIDHRKSYNLQHFYWAFIWQKIT